MSCSPAFHEKWQSLLKKNSNTCDMEQLDLNMFEIEGKAVRYRFERGPYKDHSSQVWLNVVKLFP
jgi:hypothetical protein